ncbi:MAG: hypothetical protein JKY17_06520 [Magnetovibrio sp.]|nr:hypothetical protein [Magnetovibrio sp.]
MIPQKFETAPKDGKPIDIWLNGNDASRLPNVRWNGIEWVDEFENPVVGEWDTMNKITHWCAVPKLSDSGTEEKL